MRHIQTGVKGWVVVKFWQIHPFCVSEFTIRSLNSLSVMCVTLHPPINGYRIILYQCEIREQRNIIHSPFTQRVFWGRCAFIVVSCVPLLFAMLFQKWSMKWFSLRVYSTGEKVSVLFLETTVNYIPWMFTASFLFLCLLVLSFLLLLCYISIWWCYYSIITRVCSTNHSIIM